MMQKCSFLKLHLRDVETVTDQVEVHVGWDARLRKHTIHFQGCGHEERITMLNTFLCLITPF